MFVLKCKNCGANVYYDKNKGSLVCEFCQTFHDIYQYKDGFVRCDGENVSVFMLQKYNKALQIMANAQTKDDYAACAELFGQTGNLFDSERLLNECLSKSNSLKYEKEYVLACQRMKSTNPEIIMDAHDIFVSLLDYKDSKDKARECQLLCENNERLENINRLNAQKLERKQKRKEKVKSVLKILVVLLFIAIIACGYLLYKHIDEKKYSRDNVTLDFSAVENDFCVESGNHYVFNYNVVIENNGKLNIESINGSVTFEDKDGNLIVSTNVSFTDYPVAVAAGEKSKFLWELSVYSLDDAEKLYYTDKDDVSIKVSITEIVFSDGKTMKYDG